MTPQRFAFIDIGTNSILCLIAELRNAGRFRVLEDLASITRIGQGVDKTGLISPEGEERSLQTLRHYAQICENLGVEEITAVGTSALREARNSREVRSRWRERLGIEVRVISGEQEAAYAFSAIARGLSVAGRELLVIDIGGGSTEFIRGGDTGVTETVSVALGSVRLTERYLRSDPVRLEEFDALTAAIDHELEQLPEELLKSSRGLTLIGIAGTFTTLAAVDKKLLHYSHHQVHGSSLHLAEVQRQVRLFRDSSVAERKQIPGLEPKRADVILAGARLIERIMEVFSADRVIVNDQGVRYGLLHERLDQVRGC